MKNTKPLVNVATVCEKILTEKDNVFSCIRIVDVFHLPPEATKAEPEVAIPISSLISIKAGDYIGDGELSLAVETPDGKRSEVPTKWPLLFQEGAGANVIFNFALSAKHLGTSWVEVLWSGELLTKFPVKLELRKTEPDEGEPQNFQ